MSRAIRVGLAIPLSASLIAQTPPLPNSAQLLGFLNQTVGWYGRLDAEGRLADQPTDWLYGNDDRQLATQVVARSFEFAKAYAQLLSAQEVTEAPAAAPQERYQPLRKEAGEA